jgi:hypothetical protein
MVRGKMMRLWYRRTKENALSRKECFVIVWQPGLALLMKFWKPNVAELKTEHCVASSRGALFIAITCGDEGVTWYVISSSKVHGWTTDDEAPCEHSLTDSNSQIARLKFSHFTHPKKLISTQRAGLTERTRSQLAYPGLHRQNSSHDHGL